MIAELIEFSALAKTLISLLKEVFPKLPKKEDKEKLETQIRLAEQQLAIAEATVAKNLGYELCKCTFPPQIMLLSEKPGTIFKCNVCHREINRTPANAIKPIDNRYFI